MGRVIAMASMQHPIRLRPKAIVATGTATLSGALWLQDAEVVVWRRFVFALVEALLSDGAAHHVLLSWPRCFLTDGLVAAAVTAACLVIGSSHPKSVRAISAWGALAVMLALGWPTIQRSARCEAFLMHDRPPYDDTRAANRLFRLGRAAAGPHFEEARRSSCQVCFDHATVMLRRFDDPSAGRCDYPIPGECDHGFCRLVEDR